EWDNLQVGLRIPSTNLLYTGNAGAARSVGLEVESVFHVTPELDFSTSLSYTDAKLTESIPDLPQPSGVLGVVDGERLPGTPRFTMSNAISYTRPIGDETTLRLRLDHQYVGRSYNAFTRASALELGDFSVVNFSGGLDWGDTRFDLFVKNIGNSDGVANANFDLGLDTIRAAWRVPPRSVGIVVRQSF
ncbi:MAG TPA: TonB-dependent receptor, partial [Verrucomicrobiae bacterium]|nr:TonB-dependent receptor [Verrucomicrobiae bacterium]